jgi:hypothetical protein
MIRLCRRSFWVTAFLAVILLFQPVVLAGQGVNPDSVAADKSFDIQLTALRDKSTLQGWWHGWLAGYSAATAGQAIVYLTSDDKALRQDMALGAATTMLGAVGQLITPVLRRDADYPSYRNYVSGERTMSSDQATELLRILAAREKDGRSWKTHAIAGVVNIGSGLITWLGYKRTFIDGLENFAINTVITEAQIWTQPVRAIRDYEKYSQSLQSEADASPVKPSGEWTFSAWPGGFALRLDF